MSTFVLLDASDEGGEAAALDAALSFYQEEGEADLATWDEHSLNRQRFFNILCWVYGSNPKKYKGLVTDGTLPEDRAERCPGEWQQLKYSWNKLLASSIQRKN